MFLFSILSSTSAKVIRRYLEEDPAVTVLERHRELVGYEIYVVEQWATSRSHPTFVITTYTGDPSDKAYVGILGIPTDEASWSPRLRVYFKALNQYHARRRETQLGIVMITNLSGFPSSLTVIPVPDGDLRKHRFDFFVNENLKRMGCSGRVGISLAPPNGATVAKFHQLYRTSDKNPLYSSVIELVKLCQAALHLFDKLEIDYADGLLCDVTEKAINDWWIAIGADFYNIEPQDGILGPTTVAALLGLLMGARNRLHAVNAPVPKDPFDIQGMKRGISSFQRSQRINKTRRLDRETLRRLHNASAKAANSEGWSAVPRAVKSTVAELSGKGGEMLADAIGRRDKAGIADVETTDIGRFHQLLYGERCRWLWYAKPLKHVSVDLGESPSLEGRLVFRADDQGGFAWTGRKETPEHSESNQHTRTGSDEPVPQLPGSKESLEEPVSAHHEHAPPWSVIKRATGLIHEKRSGFGRLKDAVRGHRGTPSKDDTAPFSAVDDTDENDKRPGLFRSYTSPPASPTGQMGKGRTVDDTMGNKETLHAVPNHHQSSPGMFTGNLVQDSTESQRSFVPLGRQSLDDTSERESSKDTESPHSKRSHKQTAETATSSGDNITGDEQRGGEDSIAGSLYHGIYLDDILPAAPTLAQEVAPLLRRTNSYTAFLSQRVAAPRSDTFYPRHLSFSLAEEGMVTLSSATPASSASETSEPFDILSLPLTPPDSAPLEEKYIHEMRLASYHRHLRSRLADLDANEANWTRTQLSSLASLQHSLSSTAHTLSMSHYYAPLHHLQGLQDASAVTLRDGKEALGELGREIEMLGQRVEYEISDLRGKVEDVGLSVDDFERAVRNVEDRVQELEGDARKDEKTRWGCLVM